MKVTLASDHAGYDLRMKVKEHLEKKGIEVIDGGATTGSEPYSYVLAGQKIANDILEGKADKGIAICGTGIGISIVVNKFKGIRCGLCSKSSLCGFRSQL